MNGTTIKAIVSALAADSITLAVVFGVSISQAQQNAILAFVGTVTTAAVVVVGWLESHHIKAKAAVDAAAAGK